MTDVTPENWARAARDAGLGVGHIWTRTACPAYLTLAPEDCTCRAEEHRLTVCPQVYPLTGVVWGCSCGTSDVADTREQAEAVHAAHAMTAGAQ